MSNIDPLHCDKCGAPLSGTIAHQCGASVPPPPTTTAVITMNVGTAEEGAEITAIKAGQVHGPLTVPVNVPINVVVVTPPAQREIETPKRRGEKAYLACNRDVPTKEFCDAFHEARRQHGTACVQLYTVEGTACDLPACFVERLYLREMNRMLSTPITRNIPIAWPHERSLHQKQWLSILTDKLLEQLIKKEGMPLFPYAPDLVLERIQQQLKNVDLIFLSHLIEERQWHQSMKPLFRDYLDFMANLAGKRTHVVIFLVIERTSEKNIFLSLFPRREGAALRAINEILERIAQQKSFGYKRLPALGEVDKPFVIEMAKKTDERLLIDGSDAAIEKLFATSSTVRMIEVLRLFKAQNINCGGLGVEDAI